IEEPDDSRWEGGYTVDPTDGACSGEGAGLWAPCSTDAFADPQGNPEDPDYSPVVAYASYECSTYGKLNPEAFTSKAVNRLAARLSTLVEFEFWTGSTTQANLGILHETPYLASPSADVVG